MRRVRQKSRLGNAGFTLSEMITAVAVAGILAAVAAPVASKLVNRYRLSTATSQLAFEIARARMQAVGQNGFIRLRLEGGTYVRQRSVDGVNYVQEGVVMELPSGVVAEVVYPSSGPSFNRQGLAPASTIIVLHNGAGYKTLYTNVLGRVTTSSGQGA